PIFLDAGAVAIAGDGVPGAAEACQALGGHLQQIAGARPLNPLDGLAWPPRPARQIAAHQATRDGGVRHPELAGNQPRTPTGAHPRLADTVMHLLADPR